MDLGYDINRSEKPEITKKEIISLLNLKNIEIDTINYTSGIKIKRKNEKTVFEVEITNKKRIKQTYQVELKVYV